MIGRRAVLGGLAAMTTWGDPGQRPAAMEGRGGNPPMRPDQAAAMRALSAAGSGPAPQNAFIVAQRVIVFGTGAFRGVFVYSGTPGKGTLSGSVTAVAGTDPYGNAYLAGTTEYFFNTTTGLWSACQMAGVTGIGNAGTFAAVTFWTSPGPASQMAGPWTEQGSLLGTNSSVILAFPQGGGVFSELALSATTATLTGVPLTSLAGTAASPSKFLTDTWQSLGTLAGYTVNIGRFRLTTDNCVELDIKATGGGAQAQTVSFSVTLPAAYRPATQHDTLPMGTTKAIAAGDIWPRLLVTTAGVVTVNATPNSATTIACCQKVPLD